MRYLTDREKIEEVLGILEEEIKFYVKRWNEFRGVTATTTWAEASRFKRIKELLEDLKEILDGTREKRVFKRY